MNKKNVMGLVGLVVLSMASAHAAVVATVNSTPIETTDIAREYSQLNDLQKDRINKDANTRREIVEGAVNAELLIQAAKKSGMENDESIKQQVERFRRQLLATTYLQKNIDGKLSSSAVRDFFNKNKASYDTTSVRALHILVNSEDEAKKLLTKASAAKDINQFSELAKKHSMDPSVAENGGDLGFFTRERMVPEFASAAFNMRKGEVKGPVKSQFGYHIIKLVDIRNGKIPNFAEVESRVKEDLRAQLARDTLQQLRNQAKISINEDAVKSLKL